MVDEPKYTYEEVTSFLDHLGKLMGQSAKDYYTTTDPDELIETGLSCILRTTSYTEERHRILFKVPLEDMPLYINNGSTALREVAVWRLKIGK